MRTHERALLARLQQREDAEDWLDACRLKNVLHLWFTATTFPDQFAQQQESTAWWTRLCDVAFAVVQIGAAVGVSGMHPEFAMLFVAAAVAILIASLVIEPATARAAFRGGRQTR